MFSNALRTAARIARTSRVSLPSPGQKASQSLQVPRFSQSRTALSARRFSAQAQAEGLAASPADTTPAPISETQAESPASTQRTYVRDTSPVIMLLGLNDVSESQVAEKVKNLGLNPTAILYHVSRAPASFLDFPNPETATQAMKVASALPGVTEVVQLFSKKYQDRNTVLISGRADVENLKAAFGEYSIPSYRTQKGKEAFAVLRFTDIESAAKAQKTLTSAGGIGRKIVLKAEADL